MKKNYNTLHPYILDNYMKEYNKETVNGLFRSLIEPVIENQNFTSCIVFRLLDISEKHSLIQRLSFSKSRIFSFNDVLKDFGYKNIEKSDIWNQTEFVIVIGTRYSACLLWDYSLSDKVDHTPICYLYNSKKIGDIAKKVAENSSIDLKDTLLSIVPDRRDNKLLNTAINSISSILNSRNEEFYFSELEKEKMINHNEKIETAEIIAEKAKFVVHEIKNNLSIINLYSKISQKRLEKVKTDKETLQSLENSLKNIINASESISAHINDLRCFSSLYKTEFDIKQSILSVVSQCEEKAKKIGTKIIIENFENNIIVSDRIKFECALLNVIYNAIEACNKGCIININCKYFNGLVKVYVKNDGLKIPDDIQSKIFELNFTTKETGNGLGLAICKKQLELSDGSIRLLHSNEKETLFEIALSV